MPLKIRPCSRCYHPVRVPESIKGADVLCHKHAPAKAKRSRKTKVEETTVVVDQPAPEAETSE